MSSFLWTTGLNDMNANRMGLQDEDKSDLWHPRAGYSYQLRNPALNKEQYGFFALWPASRGMMNDWTVPQLLGAESSPYEPVRLAETGSARLMFIHGVCRDGAGNPLAAAVLDFFLTAGLTYVGSCSTDSNGIYSFGTLFTGVAHKAYANYGPDTLVGATVDTLIPVSSPW